MKLNTYLVFDGRCQEAFQFYEKVLGGKIVSVSTYGESMAEHTPPEAHHLIVNAEIELPGGPIFYLSDAMPKANVGTAVDTRPNKIR